MLVIFEHFAAGFGGCAALVQLLFGAEAIIGGSFFHKLLGIRQINIFALRLDIRTVIAANIRAFVPIHAAVAQRAVNDLRRAFDIALLIGILDAQDELSAHLFCVQVII